MHSKRQRLLRRLALCCAANVALLILIIGLICCFSQESAYFRFGPHSNLSIMGVPINSWSRYACLHAVLLVTQVVDMLVSEFANPILGFNIYNPDKETITDFTHFELQFFAQSTWAVNGIRGALMVIVSISQFDIAVAKVIYSELAGMFTIYTLLKEKKFALDGDESRAPLLGA
jgi:hypothetical protein